MNVATFELGPRRHGRRMSLTPMIDVVFLLLIFFMLASRFGLDAVLPVAGGAGGAAGDWQGPPRLVEITPDTVLLNGIPVAEAHLDTALRALLPTADAPVILRATDDADLQRVVTVMDGLRADGTVNMILIE